MVTLHVRASGLLLAMALAVGCGETRPALPPAERRELADLPYSSPVARGRAHVLWQRRAPDMPKRYLTVEVRNESASDSGSRLKVFFYHLDETHAERVLAPGETTTNAVHDTDSPVMRLVALELSSSSARAAWAVR